MPRPSKKTDAVIKEILEDMAKGIPLAVICRRPGMPHPSVWREWCRADESLDIAHAKARDDGFDAIAVEALEIIDTPPEQVATEHGLKRDPAAVNWQKARFEARLKLLAKWDPKRYGEKVDHTSSDGTMTPQEPRYIMVAKEP